MALIENTLFGVKDKVQIAIDRLKAFEPKDRPYWLGFSGGKDSCVILKLAQMADVNFEAHYTITSVDPPELVRFIKREYPNVKRDIPHDKNGKPITMWSLLKSKTTPPTRIARYCCAELKESNGQGTVTITGVRWAESANRKNNQGMVTITRKGADKIPEVQAANFRSTVRGGVVLNDENDISRRAVEACYRTRKTIINPIIDWSDDEVWEFIHKYNVPYCELYDQGHKRLGCIGCPMNTVTRQEELEKYPKYKAMYLRCFDHMVELRKERGLDVGGRGKWQTGQDIYDWWVGDTKTDRDSMEMNFEDEE